MKLLILSCLMACAVADVSHVVNKIDESKSNIISQELDMSPEGSYQWGFQSDNGISVEAKGDIATNGETASQTVQGQVQYTAPGGEPIALQYIADENGYQPQGAHLPTPPPIPPAILRALEYIRTHLPPQEEVKRN